MPVGVSRSRGALEEFANQLHTLMAASKHAVGVIPTLAGHTSAITRVWYADQVYGSGVASDATWAMLR